MVVGEKVWECTNKMAQATIEIAKKKYKGLNVNAIVAIKKGDMIILRKDVFDNTEALIEEVTKWTHGGYKCYYTTKKG